jgi:peptidoglycan/LPS O-acetylase OafA/YrhL
VLLAALVAGYLILTPDEYEALAESAIYSSAFLANVYFWLHTGYFDQSAETMPLLHLWSIGVEEQFYLIWPLSIVLIWRYVRLSRAATLASLIVITALLAILCIVWTTYDAKSAFYLPFTRLWQFTLGALLLALPRIRHSWLADGVGLLGILAMGYAVLTFDTDLSYPGYYATIPSVGAAAVIAAGEQSLVGRILSIGPSVLLGKISYSLYLWHWPIFVFYRAHLNIEPGGAELTSLPEKLSLIALATAIAFVSWRYIELPVRRRRDRPRLHVSYGAIAALGVGCLALVVFSNAGFSSRLPVQLRPLASHDKMTKIKCSQRVAVPGLSKGSVCIVGAPWGSGTDVAVLWGDSHAFHLAPLFDLSAKRLGLTVVVWKGCAPFVDDVNVLRKSATRNADFSSKCGKARKAILGFVRANPDIKLVIIANAWPNYPSNIFDAANPDQRLDTRHALRLMETGSATTIAEIAALHRTVLLMGDIPRAGFNVPDCLIRTALQLWRRPCSQDMSFLDRDSVLQFHRPTETILASLASDKNRVYYVDVQKKLCGDRGCPLTIGGEVIYADGHHLRRDLSLSAKEKLISLLNLDVTLRSAINGGSIADAH